MGPLPSPRLSGVMILRAEATVPEYAGWKRQIKSAFTAKGTWAHCDGTCSMPMPEAGPNFFAPVSKTNPQPQLLEDRKAWMKKDRDAKVDIFFSISDEIKLEVFEVGPPLPPTAMSAKEMLDALDDHFGGFKFEDYHHVFCHFLNLHIDQYTNIEEFNAEFQATLEDLADHGHPMSNVQACSAYFSKLRCTQNPWVAKQIKAWHTPDPEPQLAQLMRKCPPWSIIRPLATSTRARSHNHPNSIPEEPLDTPPQSEGEYTPSEHSIATVDSKPSHSRDSSNATQRSQEITIHASMEDLNDLGAFPDVPTGIPIHFPKHVSSISKLSLHSLPPINRPLPPIPASAERSRSASPKAVTPQRQKNTKPPTRLPSPTTSLPGLEQTHPALRSPLPRPEPAVEPTNVAPVQADIHPAFRQSPSPPPQSVTAPELQADVPSAHMAAVMRAVSPSPPLTVNITLSPPSNPTLAHSLFERPTSSRSAMTHQESFNNWSQSRPLLRVDSDDASSVLSLPLQGTERSVMPEPEFADTTIVEAASASANSSPKSKKTPSKIELARQMFEGRPGVPSRGFGLHVPSIEEEKKARKRSWSIKARLSARHGIKEII